jgi:hypothetical protein
MSLDGHRPPTLREPSTFEVLPSVNLLSLAPEDLTQEKVLSALTSLPDTEALHTCANLILNQKVDGHSLARQVIHHGLTRGEVSARKIEADVTAILKSSTHGTGEAVANPKDQNATITKDVNWAERPQDIEEAVKRIIELDESLRIVLESYSALYEANKRLDTFDILSPPSPQSTSGETEHATTIGDVATGRILDGPEIDIDMEAGVEVEAAAETEVEVELDDPWAEAGAEDGATNDDHGAGDISAVTIDDPWETGSNTSARSVTSPKATAQQALPGSPRRISRRESTLPPERDPVSFSLPQFLARPTVLSAIELASSDTIWALKIVCNRHAEEIFPFRFAILENLPDWVAPAELEQAGLLPRLGADGQEKPWKGMTGTSLNTFFDHVPETYKSASLQTPLPSRPKLSSDDLAEWYSTHIESLDNLGMLDLQLAWVQHGASSGIPSLGALGEDLSLLSRLIYDAELTPAQHEKWNLATWRAASETEIVSAYLSNSTPSSIVSDIRRLVLPYLYVLESRAERSGRTDPNIVERHLHDAILSLPLTLALPVFEASKATLPLSDRLIRNDVNVARLALAVLYGSDDRGSWSVKSSIFECLPVWDVSGGDLDSDKEATSTTLESIATFVRPTKSSLRPPNAKDLFIFFHPLPFASLSRALDILDVHLESGEILARWEVPVQLRFLLQSARDGKEQKDLAERVVRRNTGRRTGDQWVRLWDDMKRLNGGDDALLRGAFGMLSVEEMMRVYLGGVLSSGSESSITYNYGRSHFWFWNTTN